MGSGSFICFVCICQNRPVILNIYKIKIYNFKRRIIPEQEKTKYGKKEKKGKDVYVVVCFGVIYFV